MVSEQPSLRGEHVDATRRALLASARRLFGTRGFSGTSLDDIAGAARLTKGALYHHFRNKEQLFREVYDEVEREATGQAAAAAARGEGSVLDRLGRGFDAFLDMALDPAVRRIALIDAPAVLGIAAFQEIGAKHSEAGVLEAVRSGIRSGDIARVDPEALTHLLLGACSQAALLIANAEDPRKARTEIGRTLRRLLAGLAP